MIIERIEKLGVSYKTDLIDGIVNFNFNLFKDLETFSDRNENKRYSFLMDNTILSKDSLFFHKRLLNSDINVLVRIINMKEDYLLYQLHIEHESGFFIIFRYKVDSTYKEDISKFNKMIISFFEHLKEYNIDEYDTTNKTFFQHKKELSNLIDKCICI